jgi:hypothetical protein
MVATLSKSSVSTETMLYQAVVDHEFRTELMDTPDVFGIDYDALLLPDAVEPQEQESLRIWSEGLAAVDIYDCASSCSAGPMTIVCDGGTK